METIHDLDIKMLGLKAKQFELRAETAVGLKKEMFLIQSKIYLLRKKEQIERKSEDGSLSV